jgi:hypothetical protein
LTVTDQYGNSISTGIEIPAPENALTLTVLVQQNQTCNGNVDAYIILSATGGWGDYRYARDREPASGNLQYTNVEIFDALETGEHRFHAVDKYGATAQLNLTITEPDILRASVQDIENVSCKNETDGQIIFNISGGNAPYYFRETGADIWKKGNTIPGLAAGEYTFEFTDSLQCICPDILTVMITEPDSLLFRNIEVTHTTCGTDNGKIAVSLTGGTRPYAYQWIDPENNTVGTDSIINNLKQNVLYRLFVTDKNSCTQYFEQLINGSALPQIVNVETTNVLCYGGYTGAARITEVTAGQPFAPYTFAWDTGQTDDFAENLSAGQHFVTVTDTNNCSTTYYFDITQPDSLYIRIPDYREPHCFGYSDGFIHTQTYGGTGEYAYLWSNGATTPDIDDIPKGEYWVRVTDSNGCIFELRFTLNEPPYQSIDLGEDVWMCPGNTHIVDGGDYVSYRWFTETSDHLSNERYLNITEEGHYFLEAEDLRGCSVWGDISVLIGNSALQADMLLASQAATGDTLYIFELSNLPLDSLKWEYDPQAFERLENSGEYDLPYVLQLKCLQTGLYNIGLLAYSGGCYSPAIKQVEVVQVIDDEKDDWAAIEPLIKSLAQFPNPTDGHFTVEIELREIADIDLKLFDVVSGSVANQRRETGSDFYQLNYSLSELHSGVYVLIVTAGNERRQVKIIIK